MTPTEVHEFSEKLDDFKEELETFLRHEEESEEPLNANRKRWERQQRITELRSTITACERIRDFLEKDHEA